MTTITYQTNKQLWSLENTAQAAGFRKTTEEPAESVRPIVDRLTALKAESVAAADPFGRSPADREIDAIAATLAAFGVRWYYTTDDAGKWVAALK